MTTTQPSSTASTALLTALAGRGLSLDPFYGPAPIIESATPGSETTIHRHHLANADSTVTVTVDALPTGTYAVLEWLEPEGQPKRSNAVWYYADAAQVVERIAFYLATDLTEGEGA